MEIKRKFAPYCCCVCAAIAAIIGFGTSSDSRTPVKAEKELSSVVKTVVETPNTDAVVDDEIVELYSQKEDSAIDEVADDSYNASCITVNDHPSYMPEAQMLEDELVEFPYSYELETDDDEWFGTAVRYNEATGYYESTDGEFWPAEAEAEEADPPVDPTINMEAEADEADPPIDTTINDNAEADEADPPIGPAIWFNDETQEYETSDGNSWKEEEDIPPLTPAVRYDPEVGYPEQSVSGGWAPYDAN